MRISLKLRLACFAILAAASMGLNTRAQTVHYNGGLKYEIWGNAANPITGTAVDVNLWGTPATETGGASAFNSRTFYPNDSHENYQGAMSGTLTVPVNGDYYFHIRSDDSSQLFFNPNGETLPDPINDTPVAAEGGCCAAFMPAGDARTAGPFTLTAGQKYGVIGIWKEGGGGDYMQVAWSPDGAVANAQIIPFNYLSGGPGVDAPALAVTTQPQNADIYNGRTAIFDVKTSAAPGQTFQWQSADKGSATFQNIAGATSQQLKFVVATADDGKQYRVVITAPENQTATSAVATLKVSPNPDEAIVLTDVTQPGDAIVASSNNSPGSEGVANVIDNQPTKYLNFDGGSGLPTGFTVTPSVGTTVVRGLTLTSANDGPERDPATYVLEGSNNGANWTQISQGDVPPFGATRFLKVQVDFVNNAAYKQYRLTFPTTRGPSTCCMQVSEVELLGFVTPPDVTQPGDPIVASSNNSPGSEGVANVIDNQPTKYLNFDGGSALPTGFTVSPSVGGTIVTGIGLTSANDAADRDPADFTLEGSLDGKLFTVIAQGTVPAFPARFQTHNIFFPNALAFNTYRVTFPHTQGPSTCCMQISEVELFGVTAPVPSDVTQPGDPIVASSNNSPGSEGVANVIDNQPTKYLNFDGGTGLPTGFTVTPSIGSTILKGITLTAANDAADRDPKNFVVEGSNDDGTTFVTIATGDVNPFPARFDKQVFFFSNKGVFKTYRVTFPQTQGPSTCCMQISEVELLGFLGPADVTQPGDPIVASSNNSPGSEGVANVIDNQPTKYLNFDGGTGLPTGFTVTPSVGRTVVQGISLQSANDGPERDPATYQLFGSNDAGATFNLISEGSVPAFGATRFKRVYVYFDNDAEYKTYKVVFPTTAGPSTCCMQVAEVELLGFVREIVERELIKVQPTDQPVLLGSKATFTVTPTGPWSFQWFRNGNKIAGATGATYTTPAATATDNGAEYTVEVTGGGGRQLSNPAKLTIFTPSATKSIGLNFVGGGANGAPTAMNDDDIAGFQLQAHFNNLDSGSGTLANDGAGAGVLNSNGTVEDTLSVDWTTSGTWGVGTGAGDATQRMLNGAVVARATTDSTVVFNGVPTGNHSLILYTVQVPLEFFHMKFTVSYNKADGSAVSDTRYIRPMNADEYNPSPGFVLVQDTTGPGSIGNMLRFDNISPGDGVVTLTFNAPDWVQPAGTEPRRGPALNAMQLILNAPATGTPPVFTKQPVSANGVVGGGLQLTATTSGTGVTYQWLKNGQPIFGATSATFTIPALAAGDVGRYTVAASNAGGRVLSDTAVVDVLPTANITEGLSAYFKFNETTGTTAANSVTGGQNGTLNGYTAGAPSWVPGKIGNGLSFDGAGTYVFVPDYAKAKKAITAMGWVNADANALTYGPVVNNWQKNRGNGQKGQFLLETAPADADPNTGDPLATITGNISAGPNESLLSVTKPAFAGNWTHVAITANGATVGLYVNGALVSQTDYLGDINDTDHPWLAIGADLDQANPPAPLASGMILSGILDDVAVYTRSLSGPEIKAIYDAGNAGKSLDQTPAVLRTEPIGGNPPPTMTASLSGSTLTINFSAGSKLQSKSALTPGSTWTDVATTSPYTEQVTTGIKFFQAVAP